MSEMLYLITGGVAIFFIGLGIGLWTAQLRSGKQAAKAADVQRQFDDYRQSVIEHFGRTAEHFQAIGQQYRELYEHMASGADTLIDPESINEKLSLVPSAAIDKPGGNDGSDTAETAATEPAKTEIEDSEPTAQANEDSDKSPRTYH